MREILKYLDLIVSGILVDFHHTPGKISTLRSSSRSFKSAILGLANQVPINLLTLHLNKLLFSRGTGSFRWNHIVPIGNQLSLDAKAQVRVKGEMRKRSFTAMKKRFELIVGEITIRHSPPARYVGNFYIDIATIFLSWVSRSSNSKFLFYDDGISPCLTFRCRRCETCAVLTTHK